VSTNIESMKDGVDKAMSHERSKLTGLNLWNLYARVYDFLPKYFKPYQRLMADVISAVESKIPRGGRVLDAGCGTGNFAIELALRGYDVEGIDISQAMLRRARLKAKKAGLLNIEFKEWDIEGGLSLYPDAFFDCVISVNALYTLREPEAAIREYFRVLKPSGRFVLVEPQSMVRVIPIAKEIYRDGGLKEVAKLLVTQSGVGACNLIIGKKWRDGTYHYWDEKGLRNILQRACFRIDSIKSTYMAGIDLQATVVKPKYCFEMNGYRFFSAESSEDLDKVWRLRYQVYCLEMGMEPTNDSGIERDVYDDYAIHFLAADENGRAVGTLRVIYNNPIGYPMDPDFSLTDYLKVHNISRAIEAGRFAIHKDVARSDHFSIALGLFRCLYKYCCDTGTYDVFGVTSPKVLENYQMPGVEILGKPFRHAKPLYRGWWVRIRANIAAAREYEEYLRMRRGPARVT
jgi:ubiquinone/menaquinone biosynthesis C-methylase UbiE/N-acyl-L-homoserine lactone synthetase